MSRPRISRHQSSVSQGNSKGCGEDGNTGVGRKHESSGRWRVKGKEDIASFSGDWEPLEVIMENV